MSLSPCKDCICRGGTSEEHGNQGKADALIEVNHIPLSIPSHLQSSTFLLDLSEDGDVPLNVWFITGDIVPESNQPSHQVIKLLSREGSLCLKEVSLHERAPCYKKAICSVGAPINERILWPNPLPLQNPI